MRTPSYIILTLDGYLVSSISGLRRVEGLCPISGLHHRSLHSWQIPTISLPAYSTHIHQDIYICIRPTPDVHVHLSFELYRIAVIFYLEG